MEDQTRTADLASELAHVEDEVCVISAVHPTNSDIGARLLELASREYEILEALSRPWDPSPAGSVAAEDHD